MSLIQKISTISFSLLLGLTIFSDNSFAASTPEQCPTTSGTIVCSGNYRYINGACNLYNSYPATTSSIANATSDFSCNTGTWVQNCNANYTKCGATCHVNLSCGNGQIQQCKSDNSGLECKSSLFLGSSNTANYILGSAGSTDGSVSWIPAPTNFSLSDISGQNISPASVTTTGNVGIGGMLTTTGNVGIGTTTPTEKLDVNGNILATGLAIDTNLDGEWEDSWTINEETSNLIFSYNDDTKFKIETNGNIKATGTLNAGATTVSSLTSNGNVGIGTDSPTEKLDVNGNIKATGTLNAGATIVSSLTSSGSAAFGGYGIDSNYSLTTPSLYSASTRVGFLGIGTGKDSSGSMSSGSVLAIGDNDTGFKQNGDGILEIYANGTKKMDFKHTSSGIHLYDDTDIFADLRTTGTLSIKKNLMGILGEGWDINMNTNDDLSFSYEDEIKFSISKETYKLLFIENTSASNVGTNLGMTDVYKYPYNKCSCDSNSVSIDCKTGDLVTTKPVSRNNYGNTCYDYYRNTKSNGITSAAIYELIPVSITSISGDTSITNDSGSAQLCLNGECIKSFTSCRGYTPVQADTNGADEFFVYDFCDRGINGGVVYHNPYIVDYEFTNSTTGRLNVTYSGVSGLEYANRICKALGHAKTNGYESSVTPYKGTTWAPELLSATIIPFPTYKFTAIGTNNSTEVFDTIECMDIQGGDGINYLIYNRHTEAECTAAGGTIQADGTKTYCLMNAVGNACNSSTCAPGTYNYARDYNKSCPAGWTQYQKFGTTTAKICDQTNMGVSMGGSGYAAFTACTTSSHSSVTNSLEKCNVYVEWWAGDSTTSYNETCNAIYNQIGCY